MAMTDIPVKSVIGIEIIIFSSDMVTSFCLPFGQARMQPPRYQDYAETPEEALERSEAYRSLDPFPDLPHALLSSEHVQAYVRRTGMLYPFHPDRDGALKAASYEINPGGRFIYWDPKTREKIIKAVSKESPLILPANSITFAELESEFYLPDYIAVRFNLRIQHVHRGILLGTGPLVDPGFKGKLLIPLHNLTSDPYEIKFDEGLIWVEFTKTSRGADSCHEGASNDKFFKTPREKTDRPVEIYFEKANRNNPIQSSLQQAVDEIEGRVQIAENAAKTSRNALLAIFGVGFLAILGAGVAMVSFFETIKSNHFTVVGQAMDAKQNAAEAKADAKISSAETKQFSEDLKQLSSSSGPQIKALTAQLLEAQERIARLEKEIQRIAAQTPRQRRGAR